MATASNTKKITASKQDDNEFSFRELLLKSLNYLPLFAVFMAVSLTIAVVYIHFQTPVYATSIKLLLKDVNNKSTQTTTVSDQVLPQVFFASKTNLANETEILRSQTLMQRVVLHQQLNTIYYSIGKVNNLELFDVTPASKFVQFSAIKDSSRSYNITIRVKDGTVYVLSGNKSIPVENHKLVITPYFNYILNIADFSGYKPDYEYSATWRPTAATAAGLAGALGIVPLSKDASILVISTSSQVPLKSEVILNTLVDEYNNYNIDQNNRIADNTINFIDERLLVISGELNTVENGLKSFKENNALDIQEKGTQEMEIAKTLQDKLNDQELQVNIANMVSQYVNNPARRYELVPSNLGIGDATLSTLVSSYNEGVLKREELLKTLGAQNLEVKTLESQLDNLRSKIIESINNIKAAYNTAYNAAYSQYSKTLDNIRSIPEKEKQLLEIERQQGIKEKLYLYLLQKREESAVSRAAAIGKSEPIDWAKSSGPINLKNANVYLLAFFAGLGIPLLIVYLMDLLNDRVTTRDEILKFTDAPIIGEISHFAGYERKMIAGKTRGVLPEQFRIVRTNLRYFLSKDKPGSCIMVTSTMPGEGKTFISINMAAVLAISGKRTVLIELDMRRPKISEALKFSGTNNDLPAFLAGNIEPKAIVMQTEGVENLFVITTTFLPPNPAELLLSDRLPELFRYLKSHFDYIVIDTPPLGVVSDARILSEYADMCLYIVRQRYTQRRQLKTLNVLYQEKKLPNLALVVNDVKLKGIRSYYGYGYTYGSYGYDYSLGYDYSPNGKGKKRSPWRKLLRPRK
jgi:tyrosine-protein kinase Etk/Wzc